MVVVVQMTEAVAVGSIIVCDMRIRKEESSKRERKKRKRKKKIK